MGDLGKQLHIYLHSPLRENAETGRINIFRRIEAALPGWTLVYAPDTEEERAKAVNREFNLFHMHEPTGPNVLCLRKAYHFPFWRIEATNRRWDFDVARETFDPQAVPPSDAGDFMRRWRPKIFGSGPVGNGGYILMPLQGRILEHRSFQSMSPLEMIVATLDKDRKRRIIATLHPKEIYSAEDMAALDSLASRHPRFRLVAKGAADLLGRCDYVVTQNSSVALTGYFAAKPAVLFAGIDFHHIAGSVQHVGLAAAFQSVSKPQPDFAAYLCWFFWHQCINGGAGHAEEKIRVRLQRHGWLLS